MEGGGAYGAGRAGAPFNPIAFIKKPEVIIRLISLFFSIIVFGCISARGWTEDTDPPLCLYGGDANACGYGVGIGVLAFLLCIAFLVLEALFDQISGVQHRKYAVMADIGVSALWCFLWFVGFCYLTNKWVTTPNRSDVIYKLAAGNLQAAIAFSFFSIFSWGGSVALAVLKYRKGVDEFGATDNMDRPDIAQSSNPYASFGGEVDQSYQQAPFSGPDGSQAPAENYQPPTY